MSLPPHQQKHLEPRAAQERCGCRTSVLPLFTSLHSHTGEESISDCQNLRRNPNTQGCFQEQENQTSRATLSEEPSHSTRDRHGCYRDAKTWAQHLAKHTRGAPVHLPAGMEKQTQEPGTLSQGTRGERLFITEELDVLDLPRLPWRAALRLGRNTSTSSSSSPQAALPFFQTVGQLSEGEV